jgi:hypothetical protein
MCRTPSPTDGPHRHPGLAQPAIEEESLVLVALGRSSLVLRLDECRVDVPREVPQGVAAGLRHVERRWAGYRPSPMADLHRNERGGDHVGEPADPALGQAVGRLGLVQQRGRDPRGLRIPLRPDALRESHANPDLHRPRRVEVDHRRLPFEEHHRQSKLIAGTTVHERWKRVLLVVHAVEYRTIRGVHPQKRSPLVDDQVGGERGG